MDLTSAPPPPAVLTLNPDANVAWPDEFAGCREPALCGKKLPSAGRSEFPAARTALIESLLRPDVAGEDALALAGGADARSLLQLTEAASITRLCWNARSRNAQAASPSIQRARGKLTKDCARMNNFKK